MLGTLPRARSTVSVLPPLSMPALAWLRSFVSRRSSEVIDYLMNSESRFSSKEKISRSSYKVRGAYNLISSLGATERARGVVCASAGNHAQGLALSCALLKIKGQVFLPANAPRQKRERILAIGESWVEQVIVGSSCDEASTAARAHAALTSTLLTIHASSLVRAR